MRGTGRLADLYHQYHQDVQFLKIYIREAHPVDGWWFGNGFRSSLMRWGGIKAANDVYDPKTLEERRAVAADCADALNYGIRTYVDEMDDAVNQAYAAWPTRLYLIGLDGSVVYHGGLGPFDFSPRKLGKAIEGYLTVIKIPA